MIVKRSGTVVTADGHAIVMLDPDRYWRSLAMSELTPTELRTLVMVADGFDCSDIAERFQISKSAARARVWSACHKLGVSKKQDAVLVLMREGVIV